MRTQTCFALDNKSAELWKRKCLTHNRVHEAFKHESAFELLSMAQGT